MRKRDRTHEEHQLIQNHHDLVRNKRYKIDQEKAQELAQLRDEQC